jgi:hypothetical protein
VNLIVKTNPAWERVHFEEIYDRDASPIIKRILYDGPHGPAVAESSGGTHGLRKGKGVETGRTHVRGDLVPPVDIDCDAGPQDFTLRRGIEGRIDGAPLRLLRPRFGLLPSRRAIHFELGEGRRWMVISSGFARCELRRNLADGEPVFRTPNQVVANIQPEEVALVIVCRALGTLCQQTKILGRLVQGI